MPSGRRLLPEQRVLSLRSGEAEVPVRRRRGDAAAGRAVQEALLMRNGSYTSSSVAASSPTATATVPSPTGPPSNFSMIVFGMCAYMSSSAGAPTAAAGRYALGVVTAAPRAPRSPPGPRPAILGRRSLGGHSRGNPYSRTRSAVPLGGGPRRGTGRDFVRIGPSVWTGAGRGSTWRWGAGARMVSSSQQGRGQDDEGPRPTPVHRRSMNDTGSRRLDGLRLSGSVGVSTCAAFAPFPAGRSRSNRLYTSA